MAFVWKIGAEAGAGVTVTGRILAKCFSRGGLAVVGYPEYPSLVRGGHNTFQVHTGEKGVYCQRQSNHVVVALNRAAVFFHKDSISKGGGLIYDAEIDIRELKVRDDIKLYPLPLSEIIKKMGADQRMKNTIALGATLALIDYPFEKLEEVLTDEFRRKGEAVVKKNVDVAKAGYEYMKANFDVAAFGVKVMPLSGKRKLLMTGNEAIALGAIKGGLKLFASYPMTPASPVLHYLAAKEHDANIVVKQPEDEISAVNYAVGAAYAGVRSMTATSGGGFALKTETIGMAAQAETPLVVYLAQRVGPSTGMPTWTEQADLKLALNASQGDFLRIILAPGDLEESFYLTAEALNLAERYQLPVIIIGDKFLGESIFTTDGFDEKSIKIDRGKIAERLNIPPPGERFKRYKITKDGVSPRCFPGQPNGMHVASSYTHDENGFSTESFIKRVEMVEKRARKLKYVLKDIPQPVFYGPEDADITLITWGSQKLPARAAIEVLEKEGIRANLLHFSCVFPLDAKKIRQAFRKCKKTLMLENNSTAQFAGILREYTGVRPNFFLLRFDGRPFFAGNIVSHVKALKENGYKGPKRKTVKEEVEHEYYYPSRFGV